MKKLVRVQLSVDLIIEMLTTGWSIEYKVVCSMGLPRGAKLENIALVNMGGGEQSQVVELYFSHPTFAEVLEGQTEIPVFTPEYGAIHG